MSILSKTLTKNNYRTHIICWAIFIIYEVFISGFIVGYFASVADYLTSYTLNILLFYCHAYFLHLLTKKKSLSFKLIALPIFIILEILVYVVLIFYIEKLYTFINFFHEQKVYKFDKSFIISSSWRALYFIGFSSGYHFILRSFSERKRADKLEKQSLRDQIEKQNLENDLIQSENNFLRSQINPHFLFNTLNFIYNDTRKKAPIAADAIMNLAEMMRYALKRPNASELVPLQEEVEQIEHLINLHKLRTSGIINLELDIKNDLFGVKFPPLILLTLVENMFKHGNLTLTNQTAVISIEKENSILTIRTINPINNIQAKESTKVGMENIRKRLENSFKNNFEFTFNKDLNNRYTTEIRINLPAK